MKKFSATKFDYDRYGMHFKATRQAKLIFFSADIKKTIQKLMNMIRQLCAKFICSLFLIRFLKCVFFF